METAAPFEPSEILLLGPGPSPVASSVLRAQALPVLGHLDSEFVALMDRVQDGLRAVFGTRNRFTLPISGTGSAGMEACLTNVVEPGDRVVVGVHGVFGGRIADLAARLGAEVVRVEALFGSALDEAAMAAAIAAGPTRLVCFVHAETSTGVLQPCERIVAAAREADALVLADCVTSLGGLDLGADARGFDLVYSGTQKCLSVPPGLAPVTVSDRALERIRARRSRVPSWYFDFALLAGYWDAETSRAYHHTAPVSMVYGLHEGLRLVLEEGLEDRARRHRQAAERLYAGLDVLGLECVVVEPRLRTPMLTSVRIPDGVQDLEVRRCLRRDHHIEIGGGLGSLAGRAWRIGLMGEGARAEVVDRLIEALGACLGRA